MVTVGQRSIPGPTLSQCWAVLPSHLPTASFFLPPVTAVEPLV